MLRNKTPVLVALLFGCFLVPLTTSAEEAGKLDVVVSNHSFEETVSLLKNVIKEKGLAIVFEANHQNMMKMVGIDSPKSLTIGFARPQMGAKILEIEPRSALDMPLRIAVRDMGGKINVIYFKPSTLFGQYGNAKLTMMAKQKIDPMVEMFVKKATE